MHASSLITSFYKTGLLRCLKYLITQFSLYNNDRRLPGLLEPYNLFYNFWAYNKIAFIAILLCFLAHDSLLRKTESSCGKIALTLYPSSRVSAWVFPLYYFQILYYCSWQIKSYILYTLDVKILRAVCSFPLLLICTLKVGWYSGDEEYEVRKSVDYNLPQTREKEKDVHQCT